MGRGQLLAEIEPTDYRNAVNVAVAQKEAAQEVAKKADSGLRKQEVEQARIDLDRWEDEYKRMKLLVERKSLPPNDFHKIEDYYNSAKQRYDMAVEGTRMEDRLTATAQARAAEAQATQERKRLTDTQPLRADLRQHRNAKSRPGVERSAGSGGLLDRQS